MFDLNVSIVVLIRGSPFPRDLLLNVLHQVITNHETCFGEISKTCISFDAFFQMEEESPTMEISVSGVGGGERRTTRRGMMRRAVGFARQGWRR